MSGKLVAAGEVLATARMRAGMWLLASVDPEVAHEVFMAVEVLATVRLGAVEGPAACLSQGDQGRHLHKWRWGFSHKRSDRGEGRRGA